MRLCTVLFFCFFYCHSLPTFKGKNKSEDAELKRQKKMEKEEKEFRKKFKVCLPLTNVDKIDLDGKKGGKLNATCYTVLALFVQTHSSVWNVNM